MIAGGLQPRALPAAILVSLAAHAAFLSLLRPAAAPRAPRVEFPLQVRVLARPAAAPRPEVPARPKATTRPRREVARPQPAPAPGIPVEREAPPEPLRARVVADPGDYRAAPPEAARVYAWPGLLRELPYPPDGFPVAYPRRELELGTKGLVVARVDIGPYGELERLEVLCGAEPFAGQVREALLGARFRPGVSERGPVPTWVLLEFGFFAEPGGKADMAAAERAYDELQQACLKSLPAGR